MNILEVKDVEVYISAVKILRRVSLNVNKGEIVALVGRNGAGKTTTLRSIMGLQKVVNGYIKFNGHEITNLPSHRISKMGIGYAPEDRRIFSDLTAYENIKIAIRNKSKEKEVMGQILDIFPELSKLLNRKGGHLSGGEQKMVAVARALAIQPELVLLDEPLEGLAPIVVKRFYKSMKRIREYGISILISESNISHTKIADRVYVIERGEIIFEGYPGDILSNEEVTKVIRGY